MYYKRLFIALFCLLISLCEAQVQELKTVPSVDFNKYMGTWYEIARLQYPWDAECGHNTIIQYTKTAEGAFDVLTQCQTGESPSDVQKSKGKGEVVDKTTNAKMKLNFNFNYFNRHPWVFNGDYWIIQLANDYSYAFVPSLDTEFCRRSS